MLRFSYIIILFFVLSACNNKQIQHGFAIVIDSESYEQAKIEVQDYAASVELDGLKTIVIIDKWNHPDSIKAKLVDLYKDKTHPIEGVVFIGDIPVAMVREGQHFSSAFKMNEKKFAWERSSIPTDRFYDDFDLQFNYLKQDSSNQLLHYYSLKPESSQKLHSEIYSGRIKPFESKHKYKDLKKYLRKVVQIKSENNELDQMLYFGGHGYNSESMLARMDEKISLLNNFPWLNSQTNRISYIDHSIDVHVKDRLMSELQRKDLDFAILHHHGSDDTEYLSGMPKVDGVSFQIEGVKRYLRSKLYSAKRRGKNINRVKSYYHNQMRVPMEWFANCFEKDIMVKDSLFDANLNIVPEDFSNYNPNSKFIILDACFNGSFHLNEYIAGAYLFNNGNTVAVQANSVNTLQDKWSNELIGLIGLGMRVGEWSKQVAYFESHLLGDPTFKFHYKDHSLHRILKNQEVDNERLLTYVESEYADIQSLALRKLYENNYQNISDLLLKTFKQSTKGTVRMECLKLLTSIDDNNFIECLTLACNDSYELVRRQAVYLIGKSGDSQLIKPLLTVLMRNNISKRVEFVAKQTVGNFSEQQLLDELDLVFDSISNFTCPNKVKQRIGEIIKRAASRSNKNLEELLDSKSSIKTVISDIRLLRNYNYHPGVEKCCQFVINQDNIDLQIVMLEALGWYNISFKKDIIILMCNEIYENKIKYSDSVRNEAFKTAKRLSSPWYR